LVAKQAGAFLRNGSSLSERIVLIERLQSKKQIERVARAQSVRVHRSQCRQGTEGCGFGGALNSGNSPCGEL